MSEPLDMNESITRFEAFINDTLKEDLKSIDKQLEALEIEIAEFTKIKKTLIMFNNDSYFKDFKTQVDIGHGFSIEAKVKDSSNLLFNIGLNHYLEFSREEAIRYADARIEAMLVVASALSDKSAETKAHIKLMLIGIGNLQNIDMES